MLFSKINKISIKSIFWLFWLLYLYKFDNKIKEINNCKLKIIYINIYIDINTYFIQYNDKTKNI